MVEPGNRVNGIKASHCLLLYGIFGFCSMIVQATLVREFLAVIYGTELSLGMLFASWLLWIAIGAELGAYAAPKVRNVPLSFGLWLLIVACLLPIQVTLIRSMHIVLRTPPGEFPSPILSAVYMFIALLPFSLAVGFTFPLGVRLFRISADAMHRPVAWIYAVEALGSMIGGSLFTFLLVRLMPSCAMMALVSCMLCGASASIILRIIQEGLRKALICGAVILPAIIQAMFSSSLERGLTKLRWKSFGTGNMLVLSLDSPYQNIAIGKRHDQYSLFCDGHFVRSFPDEYTNASLALLLVSEADGPSNALIIGGGLEGLLSQLIAAGVEKIEYVQSDPWLIDALIPFLPKPDVEALRSVKVTVHRADARQFVRETSKRYDLIFLHLGDPSTAQLNRYYTAEFFELIRKRLSKRGVFSLHITGSESYFGEALSHYIGSIYHTLKASFGHVAVSVGETTFLFASVRGGVVTESSEELMRRAERIIRMARTHSMGMLSHSISAATMPPQILLSYFPPLRSEWLHEEMRKLKDMSHSKGSLINRDLHPTSYMHYLRLWLHKSHPQAMAQIESSLKVAYKWLLAVLAILLLVLPMCDVIAAQVALAFGKQASGATRRFALLVASLAGMSAMGLELILLIAFQSLHSALYQMVGILVATFMFGLSLGSMLIGKLRLQVHRRLLGRILLSLISLLIALFAFSLPYALIVISGALTQALLLISFLLLLAISGFLTGAALPAAVWVYHSAMSEQSEANLVYATGKVDRADHLGASIGALIVPVVMFPMLGLDRTCFTIGVLNALAALFVLCSSVHILPKLRRI